MFISKEIEWDMGHRVPNHKSKCSNPHGHRYKACITLEGNIVSDEGVSDEGMVIDFSDIKNIAKEFIDTTLDHGFMFYSGDKVMDTFFEESAFKYIRVDFIPTAENMAKYLFEKLQPKFIARYDTNLKLSSITVWETPTSFVVYKPEII